MGADRENATRIRKFRHPVVMAIGLLPVFIITALFLIGSIKSKSFHMQPPDIFILAAALLYFIILVLIRNKREYFFGLILAVYAFSFTLLAIEMVLKFIEPNLPWYPMHRVTYAKEGVMPGTSGRIEFSVNRYGLRGPDADLKKAALKILAVGGSTTECLYITDKLSWPWMLGDKLSAVSKKNIFVGNAGHSGQITLHHIYMLQEYDYAPDFDWIIVLAGINDAGRSLHNDYEKIKNRVKDETFVNKGGKRVLFKDSKLIHRLSNFYHNSVVLPGQVLQDKEGMWHQEARQMRKAALKSKTIDQVPQGLNEATAVYKNNLKTIISICHGRNQKLIMLTQPTLWHKDLPAAYDSLIIERQDDGSAFSLGALDNVIHAYNQAMMDICREEGVVCIDLASLLSGDYRLFYDDCHLNISGCERVADILAEEMVKHI